MNHWCTNQPQACFKKRKVGRGEKGQKQVVKAFPLKALKKAGSGDGSKLSEGASTHPVGLCDKYDSAATIPSLFPTFFTLSLNDMSMPIG